MSNPVDTLVVPAPEPPESQNRLGPIGRARASLAAIEVLLRLREDQAEPTGEDLKVLRNWPGWGPLAPALAPDRTGTWADIGEQLQRLLPPREYRQAEQGTSTAYYTPGRIADACWSALSDLGFTGGRMLEPGCGAGTFMDRTPAGLEVDWFGVERDPTTAGIAALLHPDAEIVNARLQDAALRSNSVDAVLGNVPYGNFPVFDKTAPKSVTDSIHNYFIWRSVQALRPGGVAILLTSRYTMDSEDESARRAIAQHADLLGAIRLPNGALAEGGTGVLADILVVRRRDGGHPVDDSWMGTSMVPGVPGQSCNDYFLAHPEHVLGTFAEGRAPRYGHTLEVKAPEGQDLTAALEEAFGSITAAARTSGREWRVASGAEPWTLENLPFPVREDGRKEGSFHLVGGRPHEVVDGELAPVERAGKELPKLIELRDATLKLIEAETHHDTPDEQLEPLRAEVNRLYDAYVTAHGPINRYTLAEGAVDEETGLPTISRRYPRLGGFRRDPDFVSVLALEDFDDETQTAQKAALLTRRVNRRIDRPTSAESPEEALSLCLNFTNRVDVPTIARLLSVSEEQVPEALGDLVFTDPDSGDLLTAGEYLSGQVVDKLERAEFHVAQGRTEFARHVEALKEVQPEPLTPEEIRAKLGAPWIPVEDVTDFAEQVLGARADITHVARTATWSVDMPMTVPEAATSEWGTNRVNGFELLDLALNGQAPVVHDTFRTPDGGSRRVRNDKETMLAESKQADLARRFGSWVWEDADRAERLAADYNRIFNSTVLRKHDGSHLTIDGLDSEFTPYDHQWDFVQRVLSAEEGSLCPYPVGAGKTATMFMTAIKLKQLGLVNKPMIVVPNHLLEQISRDGKRLFPDANILMAGKKDLADQRSRMLFAARCATGDWDAVVMTHQSFGRLGVHPVTEAEYLENLAAEYREALGAVEGDGNSRRIKEIAKMVDRFDARASDLRSKATDAGVTYENLGIDFLQVDEAHYYKNLALPATTEGMALGKPSKRATDLDLKILVTRERTGRDNVAALYSGTFISNSVREMFVFQHYTMPKRLERLGLGSPDAWAANFIHFESRPEVGVDGVSFRLKRRPVEYTNADEALQMFQEVAELRPREDFRIERPKRVDKVVAIEPTDQLVGYVSHISDRIDRIQGGKVKPWEDNMLKVITDGRKAALDLELVGLEPDGPGKAGAIAENVLNVYHRTKDLKLPGDPDDVAGGFQLVFCDLGTPSKEKGSQVYGKIRAQLIDGGIPRDRIRFIHDHNSDLAKEQLFSDCRAGKVSVLFASTEKAGVGTNVQTRGVALHHADPPHKPAEWEQREGRLDRPGNGLIKLGMEVEFYRYVAEHSFDSFMFQQLERKQRPIVQIMSGRKVGRVIEEIDPVGAGFAQAKAVATGNPLLLELAEATAALTKLHHLADGHRQAQSRMRRKVEVLAEQISEAEGSLTGLQAMADAVTGATDTAWRTADGRLIEQEDVPAALAQAAQGASPRLDLDAGFTWRGLNVGFTFHRRQQFGSVAYEAWAHLAAEGHERDVRLNLSWFGKGQAWRITKALGEAVDEAVRAPDEIRQKLATWRTQLEDTRTHIGRPFDRHADLEAARERKAALETAIRESAATSGRESQTGPAFESGGGGGEMTEAEMAVHDAAAMAGMAGGSAVVVSDGQVVGSARPADGPVPGQGTGAPTEPTETPERPRTPAPTTPVGPPAAAPSPAAEPGPGGDGGNAEETEPETAPSQQPDSPPVVAPQPGGDGDPGDALPVVDDEAPAPTAAAPSPMGDAVPEDAKPVPGAEGYCYTESGRTAQLFTTAGERVGTAKWSYSSYRYEGDVQGDTVRGTEDAATVAKRMANHHAAVYGDHVHRPLPDDQGRDPVWILHNGSDTLVYGVTPEDNTVRAAMWTGGGFKESRRIGAWYLPRTWKEPTRRGRVDTAVRVLAAAGRTVKVYADRDERQRPGQPARLPVLNVTPPDLGEVPPLGPAEPYTAEADMRADVEQLDNAFEQWSRPPAVKAYHNQDQDARPDGFGTPDNPIAELRVAYGRAATALRGSVIGGPEEILRRIHAVAAWSQALEPAVDEALRGPLQQVNEAARRLAARSQATVESLARPASQSAAADTPAEEQAADSATDQTPQDAPAPEPPTAPPAEAEQPAGDTTAEEQRADSSDGSAPEEAPAPEPSEPAEPEQIALFSDVPTTTAAPEPGPDTATTPETAAAGPAPEPSDTDTADESTTEMAGKPAGPDPGTAGLEQAAPATEPEPNQNPGTEAAAEGQTAAQMTLGLDTGAEVQRQAVEGPAADTGTVDVRQDDSPVPQPQAPAGTDAAATADDPAPAAPAEPTPEPSTGSTHTPEPLDEPATRASPAKNEAAADPVGRPGPPGVGTSAPSPPELAADQTQPAAPTTTPEGTEMATPARPTPSKDDRTAVVVPESSREHQDTAPAGTPRPQSEELPLWTGTEASAGDTTAAETAAGPVDVVAEFQPVTEAWTEIVPPERGTADDLLAALEADLNTLQRLLAHDVAAAPAPAPRSPQAPTAAATTRPQPSAPAGVEPARAVPSGGPAQQVDGWDPQQHAAAVNAGLRQADTHAGTLQDLPEWQQLNTVRGAFTNLWRVVRERAGEHVGRLTGDDRVQNFIRRVSLRTCEKIAEWAQAGADRLQRNGERGTGRRHDLPSAEALLQLGDAAFSYSSPGRGRGGTPPASFGTTGGELNIPEMRRLGEALRKPLPGAANRPAGTTSEQGPGFSSAAARARSTTARRGPARPGGGGGGGADRAEHLRRAGNEQQRGHKPNQR